MDRHEFGDGGTAAVDEGRTFWACPLCGATTEGMGHDPWPLDLPAGARVCGACDTARVIPARAARQRAREQRRAARYLRKARSELDNTKEVSA